MKRFSLGILFILLFFTLMGCDDTPPPIDCETNPTHEECVEVPTCEDGYVLVEGTCQVIEEDPDVNKDNPIELNIGNQQGWTFYANEKSEPIFSVNDGTLTFVQANATEDWGNDTVWARSFQYDTLVFSQDFDYIVQFQAYGTVGESFTVRFQTGTDTYQEELFELDGTEQQLSFTLRQPETIETGEILIGVGTFGNGSILVLSNFVITAITPQPQTYNVLFIGNSFTYYNDMPTMVETMGQQNGLDLHVEQVTYGGASLIDFATSGTSRTTEVINKLNEREWDFVILQDHSRKPLDNLTEMLNAIHSLDELIEQNGAQTVLYSTWSYRDGTDKLATTGLSYEGFYNVLTNGYQQAVEETGAWIAPVGTAFYNLYQDHPDINLYVDDDFHPNPQGSFLAAYVFYTLLFGTENNDMYRPATVSEDIAEILRVYAKNALSD